VKSVRRYETSKKSGIYRYGGEDYWLSSWVQIFWNIPNGLRIMDLCGFPREEHLLEFHRERGFIIPEGYKPLAGG